MTTRTEPLALSVTEAAKLLASVAPRSTICFTGRTSRPSS